MTTRGDEAHLMVAEELYRFYRAGDEETRALRGVSITADEGEVVVVAGPSGSGKSTLLACLAGLDNPSGGAVWVGGRRISHQPERLQARLRAESIGMLFQSGNLIDHLTVADNIRFAQRLAKVDGRARLDARSLLDTFGLSRRARALPRQLSGGETARVALAVAMANNPPVLLADEPTGELDSDSERVVLQALRARADEGVAVVVASHSPAVRRAADRVLTLHDGRLVR